MKRMVNDAEKLNKLTESTEVTDDSLEISKSVVKLDGTKLEVNEDEVDITAQSVKVNGQSIVAGELTPYQINIPNELTEDLEFTPPPNSVVTIKTSNNQPVTASNRYTIRIILQLNSKYIIKMLLQEAENSPSYYEIKFIQIKQNAIITGSANLIADTGYLTSYLLDDDDVNNNIAIEPPTDKNPCYIVIDNTCEYSPLIITELRTAL